MCGIFGMFSNTASFKGANEIRTIIDQLFLLSESRGKEASGFAFASDEEVLVHKQAIPASSFIKTDVYQRLFVEKFSFNPHQAFAFIGHSRLVTTGSQAVPENNQPVVKDGIIAVHNGIIVNDREIWDKFAALKRLYDVDTESICSLMRHFLESTGSIEASIIAAYQEIEGATTTALIFNDFDTAALATNNGSLYLLKSRGNDCIIFMSEKAFIDHLKLKPAITQQFHGVEVRHVEPNSAVIINTKTLEFNSISLNSSGSRRKEVRRDSLKTIRVIPSPVKEDSAFCLPTYIREDLSDLLTIDERAISAINRCSTCLLPETFPFIEFDASGSCNFCRDHTDIKPLGEKALQDKIAQLPENNGQPNCIVAFSGGRDSSYSLHYVKNILKLRPIAFSYDWGMLTDLGRRNQSRMTGALGIEHILISADIQKKRDNIRKNVSAWLRSPELGTIPLFMAGDKQYFYYANKLRKIYGIDLVIMGENHLEKTFFKNGFAGVKQQKLGSMAYNVTAFGKIQMLMYYARQFIKNPYYLNSSVLDTVGAYLSYFYIPHDYLNLFDYLAWDEETISNTIINEYNWEIAKDTSTTWRIGDGTAAFYNYIYYSVAGFSEIDTFRSNQIRSGVLSRSQGAELARLENAPRYESIKWYLDTIGLDFKTTIAAINNIPKLYST